MSPQEHTIHTSSDEDWIEIDVTDASGNLYVIIEPVPSNDPSLGVTDIDFDLENAGGTVLLSGITSFGNSSETNVLLNSGFSTGNRLR